MKNYTVYWTWNKEYDSAMNIQQTVIPNCKSQKDAEQKAVEYILDTWINWPDDKPKVYSSIQAMVDDCFASFMVTCEDDMLEYFRNHAYKYWRGRWDNPIEGLVDPILDELQNCGYFDELETGHYLGYKNLFDLPYDHVPLIARKELAND